jgi:uncharacterized protein RhaS with RHS repeats
VAAAVVIAGGGGVLLGQNQARTAGDGADIVSELRAMRTELVKTTTAAVQAQLLVGRLSIQEQRVAALTQKLVALQANITAATRPDETGQLVPRNATPRGVESFNRLRSEESELLRQLTEEQGRWTFFSGKLDELERSLPQPGR